MTDADLTDRTTYAPFILMDAKGHRALLLTDEHMLEKTHVFEERADEGWSGNGYDWTSVADVIVAERMPELDGALERDPEAGMLSVIGPRAALERLGTELAQAFRDEDRLRDLLSRAVLD